MLLSPYLPQVPALRAGSAPSPPTSSLVNSSQKENDTSSCIEPSGVKSSHAVGLLSWGPSLLSWAWFGAQVRGWARGVCLLCPARQASLCVCSGAGGRRLDGWRRILFSSNLPLVFEQVSFCNNICPEMEYIIKRLYLDMCLLFLNQCLSLQWFSCTQQDT